MSTGDLLDPATTALVQRQVATYRSNRLALVHAARAVLVAFEDPLEAGQLRGPAGTSLRLLEQALRLNEGEALAASLQAPQ